MATGSNGTTLPNVNPLDLIKWAVNQGVAVAIAGFVLYRLGDAMGQLFIAQTSLVTAVQRNSDLIVQYCK